jgi:GntR family transcriptional regulator / MocR family aminotransferase
VIPDRFFRHGLPAQGKDHGKGGSLGKDHNGGLDQGATGRRGETASFQRIDVEADTDNASARASSDPTPLFAARTADASIFPMAAWRRALMASAKAVAPGQLAQEAPQGWRPLREQVARYLGAARGISCDADQVVILTGIRDGLDLSARVLLTPQDQVLVEDPGYLTALPLFSQFTSKVVPIAIDEQGFSVERARRHRGVKLVHVTPAHQSPVGVTMPVSRRLDLLAWAAQENCWIVEDDYDSEFNYDSAPLAALKSLDTADRVIHLGSFNKTMFNALRIGYAVLPKRWVAAFTRARLTTGRSNGMIEQIALAGFLEDGSFARHIRKARAVYAQRRDLVIQVLADAVGHAVGREHLRIGGAHAGFHLVWWLPQGIDPAALQARAQAQGLSLQSIARFCRRTTLPPGIVIGYSGLQPDEIERQGALLRGLL